MKKKAEPKKKPRKAGFQKGKVSNPHGRAGKNQKLALLKHQSKEDLMTSMAKVIRMNVEECDVLSQARGVKSCDALMASVMMKGINTGNFMSAQFFMTYTFGRPSEYDPNDEPEAGADKEGIAGVPKEVLVGLLKGLMNANTKSAPVPAPA